TEGDVVEVGRGEMRRGAVIGPRHGFVAGLRSDRAGGRRGRLEVRHGRELTIDHARDVDVVQPPAVVVGSVAPPKAVFVIRRDVTGDIVLPGSPDPADSDPLAD